jgi:3-phenylpropionate/cinnamic acid dioxygenase small subunit
MADRAQINDVLGRYSWGYDQNELDAIAACFTADAVFSMRIADGDLIGPFEGREAILGLMKTSLEQQDDQRRHVSSNVFVEQESDDAATVVSYLTLIAVAGGQLNVLSSGWYRDQFVLDGDRWRIRDRYLALDLPY